MRYLPIVRLFRRRSFIDAPVEIGSGAVGMAPYLKSAIVGVDPVFSSTPDRRVRPVRASADRLPFRDASLNCVVSVDMLEHIPPADRPEVVKELVRVTRGLLVISVPAGDGAYGQDAQLRRMYIRRHHVSYPYLDEHVEHGLPSAGDIRDWVNDALTSLTRTASVNWSRNTNLRVRKLLMRIWLRGSRASHLILLMFNYLHPLLTRLNFGNCYRIQAIVEFEAAGGP